MRVLFRQVTANRKIFGFLQENKFWGSENFKFRILSNYLQKSLSTSLLTRSDPRRRGRGRERRRRHDAAPPLELRPPSKRRPLDFYKDKTVIKWSGKRSGWIPENHILATKIDDFLWRIIKKTTTKHSRTELKFLGVEMRIFEVRVKEKSLVKPRDVENGVKSKTMQGRCLADTFSPNYLPLSLVRGYWRLLRRKRMGKEERGKDSDKESVRGRSSTRKRGEGWDTEKWAGLRIGANEQCKNLSFRSRGGFFAKVAQVFA